MSEPERTIKINEDDLDRADLAKKKTVELRATIQLLEARLGDSE